MADVAEIAKGALVLAALALAACSNAPKQPSAEWQCIDSAGKKYQQVQWGCSVRIYDAEGYSMNLSRLPEGFRCKLVKGRPVGCVGI